MTNRDWTSPSTVILVLANRYSEEGVTGRTRIQKLIYFLREALPISVSYTPYYYGPYSEEVTTALDSLVARGLLCEEVEQFSVEQPFEGRVYRYKLTDDGKAVLQSMQQERRDEVVRIEECLDRALMGHPNTATLAVASKLHYVVTSSGKPIRQAELSKLAKRFGWQIESGDTRKGVRFLVDRSLVQIR